MFIEGKEGKLERARSTWRGGSGRRGRVEGGRAGGDEVGQPAARRPKSKLNTYQLHRNCP